MSSLAVSFITGLLHEKFNVPLLAAQFLDIAFWGGAVLMNFVAIYAGLATLAERKVAAHMQARVGPYQVGPHGSLQWLADALKLLFKEDIIPNPVDRFLFKFAPYLIMAGAFAAWVTLPYTENWSPGNLNVGVIFIIAIGSVSVIAILMAGWASANKWALFGAMRAAAQIVSYEVPMGITVLAAILMAGSLNLHEISAAQRTGFAYNLLSGPADDELATRLAPIVADLEAQPATEAYLSEDVVARNVRRLASEEPAVAAEAEAALRSAGPAALPFLKPHLESRPLGALSWFVFRHAPFTMLAFLIMFICGLAETNRTPFDIPEAESELVAGYHVEYSGMRFSFFFLAEYAQMFVVAALAVTLFLGGWLPPFSTMESIVLATAGGIAGALIGRRLEGSSVGLLLGALAGGGAGQAVGLVTPFLGGRTFTWMAELVNEPSLRYFEGAFWFFGKCFALVFVMMWLRWTLPRYRVDQLMDLCWKRLTPLAFINLLAIGLIEWGSQYWT